jgi:hypothetical protein
VGRGSAAAPAARKTPSKSVEAAILVLIACPPGGSLS